MENVSYLTKMHFKCICLLVIVFYFGQFLNCSFTGFFFGHSVDFSFTTPVENAFFVAGIAVIALTVIILLADPRKDTIILLSCILAGFSFALRAADLYAKSVNDLLLVFALLSTVVAVLISFFDKDQKRLIIPQVRIMSHVIIILLVLGVYNDITLDILKPGWFF